MTGGAVSRTASNTIASAEPELKIVYTPLWSAYIGAVPVRDTSRAGRESSAVRVGRTPTHRLRYSSDLGSPSNQASLRVCSGSLARDRIYPV
jgi:hypothetical protein